MKTEESKKSKKKALTTKTKAKVKAEPKPKAAASKRSAHKPGPVETVEKKTAAKKVVAAKPKVKIKVKAAVKAEPKPKAAVSKRSAHKPEPVETVEKKTATKKVVAARAKLEAKPKTEVRAKGAVESKAKAEPKPKATVSKVPATKPESAEKIRKKTAKSPVVSAKAPGKSGTEKSVLSNVATSAAEPRPGTKRTPQASRPKISGTALMGKISTMSRKELPVPESSSSTVSSVQEKADREERATQDAERVPIKSSRARLKIFLPEQNVTNEEAEEIFFAGLPDEYGENSVIALAVDPNTVFVDWEVVPKDITAMEGDLNLRFYDITGIEFNDWNAHAVFDVLINKRVGSGFFEIRMHGRDVIVAVGILNADSGFMPIVRSDMISFPELLAFDELGIVQNLFESGIPVGY